MIDIRAGESAAPRLAPDAAVSGEVEASVTSADDPPPDSAGDDETEFLQADLLEIADADGTPVRRDVDKTEIVRFSDLERPKRAPAVRTRTIALTASAVALATVAVVAVVRSRPPRTAPARSVAAPTIVMMPPAPAVAPAGPPAPVAPVSPPIAVPPAAVAPIVKPIVAETAEPAAESGGAAEPEAKDEPLGKTNDFVVGLVGSLRGAHKYALHRPDGVAFNLPNARATVKVGTYRPAVRGLRAVWVRDLPGGGTHLRFFYTKARPVPEVRLHTDGVRVAAR